MLRPSMNQIATHGESAYSVVIGIAKRAREIADEFSNDKEKILEEKPVKTAVDEFAARKFSLIEDPAVKFGKTEN